MGDEVISERVPVLERRLTLEYCCECGCPTGRAGIADDSLFTTDDGPFCPECFEDEMGWIRAEEE